MRACEIELIPARGWRTTWMGAEAITAPLIKNAQGEPMKWWVTPPVVRACEVLERLTEGRRYLCDYVPIRNKRVAPMTARKSTGRSGKACRCSSAG